eukprot:6233616-Pyramimonas_sp.AAC.1
MASQMAGRLDPVTGEYYPSDDEVRCSMERWHTPPNDEAYARQWLKQCGSERWFACGIFFPIVWEGVRGVCLAVSSGMSTRLSKTNNDPNYQHSRGGIPEPDWVYFEAFFYAHAVFGNVAVFQDKKLGKPIGFLLDVFDTLCTGRGIVAWKAHLFIHPGQWMYSSMRYLLGQLDIPIHAEI